MHPVDPEAGLSPSHFVLEAVTDGPVTATTNCLCGTALSRVNQVIAVALAVAGVAGIILMAFGILPASPFWYGACSVVVLLGVGCAVYIQRNIDLGGLDGVRKKLEGQVGALAHEVDRLDPIAKNLGESLAQVNQLAETQRSEIESLKKLKGELEGEVGRLTEVEGKLEGEVGRFTNENRELARRITELQQLQEACGTLIGKISGNVGVQEQLVREQAELQVKEKALVQQEESLLKRLAEETGKQEQLTGRLEQLTRERQSLARRAIGVTLTASILKRMHTKNPALYEEVREELRKKASESVP